MDSITKLIVIWQIQNTAGTLRSAWILLDGIHVQETKETASYNWVWAFISKFKEHPQDHLVFWQEIVQ